MSEVSNNEIIIYQEEGQAVEVRLDGHQETVWLSQKQMVDLFGKDVRTVNEHIKNLFPRRSWSQNQLSGISG